jgi:RNA polymerase sigma-70 factor (ECF subfamily)
MEPRNEDAVDDESFAVFYRETVEPLRAYVARRSPAAPHDIDDIVQDAFLAMLPGWATRPPTAEGCRAVLFTIANRRIVDRHRLAARRPTWSGDDAIDALADVAVPGPDTIVVDRDSIRAVGNLVRALPHRQRDLVALYCDSHVSLATLGARCGSSGNAMKKTYQRAIRRLREQCDALELRGVTALASARVAFRRLIATVTTGPAVQAALIGIVASTLVLAPFPTSPGRAHADDTHLYSHDADTSTASQSAAPMGPRPAASGHRPNRAAPSGVQLDDHLAPPERQAGPLPGNHPCVQSICAGDPDEPADVITLHAPAPVGPLQIREGYAPVCDAAPHAPRVQSCHTEGDPTYLAVPPSPPPRP